MPVGLDKHENKVSYAADRSYSNLTIVTPRILNFECRTFKQGREGYRPSIGWYRMISGEDATTILAVYIGRRATTTYKRT